MAGFLGVMSSFLSRLVVFVFVWSGFLSFGEAGRVLAVAAEGHKSARNGGKDSFALYFSSFF